jgi:hypothetical protein
VKPYYDEGGVTIYHGDCLEVLPAIEADVLITDPPYGTQFSAENPKGGYGRRQNAGLGPEGFVIANDGTTETRDELLGLWGSERPAAVFGSPRLPDPPGEWNDRLVWDKKRPGMNGGPWRYRHETIFVRGEWVRVSDAATSIITAFPEQSVHIHAKPLPLMISLVGAAPPGTILDPFMGSGSTLRAAKDLSRVVIGIEIEERYCEVAAERLAQEVLDLGAAA